LDAGEIPECEICGQPLRPLVLLFDETYDSHPAYQMRIAKRCFNDSDVVVFVGTSFSVGITDYALRAALYAQSTLVNINPAAIEHDAFHQLTGKAEEILPRLADAVLRDHGGGAA
jgi:NAD-dependent deacetylase